MLDNLTTFIVDWHSIALTTALLVVTVWAIRRMQVKARHLSAALDYMSQGLCMLDASARIVFCNQQYIRMYKLSPAIVRPGCTLRQLLEHRKETGLFTGDIKKYHDDILASIATGKDTDWFIPASDGRTIHTINKPMPDGGWVSTHDDVTEHRLLQKQREDLTSQQKRRDAVDAMIV